MVPVLAHTQHSFSEAMFGLLGRGREHAARLYSHFMKEGSLEGLVFEPQAALLIDRIISHCDFSLPGVALKSSQSDTVKFLLQLEGNVQCESVYLPMKNSATLCISSQIGCQMGCSFCETGRMGLIRNMTAAEIVAQAFVARHVLKLDIRNLVFMGMGEPLDNFENVMRAIQILTDPAGLHFGPSRITVSTSGRVDGIYRLIEEADPAVNLAVSVNASNDKIRQKIMPVNRKWNLAALKVAMEAYCAHPRREIFVEYVLMKGINDSLECADELADYLRGLKVKVNLIPYNPQSNDRFAPPDQEILDVFLQRMRLHGYLTTLRKTKGRQIMAACGQLGNLKLRKRSHMMSK